MYGVCGFRKESFIYLGKSLNAYFDMRLNVGFKKQSFINN